MWIAGLKALISSGQGGRSKIDGWSDGGLYLDVILPTLNLWLIFTLWFLLVALFSNLEFYLVSFNVLSYPNKIIS